MRPEWSTVNYKDGLAVTNSSPVVRRFPMIAGVDAAGTVDSSSHPSWKPGDKVILKGWGCGETHLGLYAEKARVKGDWLIALPQRFSAHDAMAIGTAGYTAMLAVMALERAEIGPGRGPVIVTGAAGGVGSTAVALLAKLGYQVTASTGRPEEAAYLKDLGAAEVIARSELTGPVRPLAKERWAGGIDTVGSTTLANLLSKIVMAARSPPAGSPAGSTCRPRLRPSSCAACGSWEWSRFAPMALRKEAWNRLENDIDLQKLAQMTVDIELADVIDAGKKIVRGGVRGRLVVKIG